MFKTGKGALIAAVVLAAEGAFFPLIVHAETGEQPATLPENNSKIASSSTVISSPRSILERETFYRHQNDGVSCSAFSIAMMYSDHKLKRPVTDQEAVQFKALAGLTATTGYRGTLVDMQHQIESKGLSAKAYEYTKFDEQGLADLNGELALGHSAVARVINPHTGNPHYIYIAGRDASGNYILGDPDRKNLAHFDPVSSAALLKMMSGRDGFVAGW